jgi:soluble lytic murein transglycosylase
MKTLVVAFFFYLSAFAEKPSPVTLDSAKVPQLPQWAIEHTGFPKSGSPLQMQRAEYLQKRFAECVRQGDAAIKQFPKLGAWISRLQLKCANEAWAENPKANIETSAVVDRVVRNPAWLGEGAARTALRSEFTKLLPVKFLYDVKVAKAKAWKTFSYVLKYEADISVDERADVYTAAAEMAQAEQNFELALQYHERSHALRAAKSSLEKITALRARLGLPASPSKPAWKTVADAEYTAEELQLYSRATEGFKSGDSLVALDDALKFLRLYPGSHRAAEINEKTIEQFLTLMSKDDDKSVAARENYLNELGRAHPQRKLEWGKKCLSRGYFKEALALVEPTLRFFEDSPNAGAALEVVARSAWHGGQDALIKKYMPMVFEKAAGTGLSAEMMLAAGLWEYSQKNYSQSAFHLERLLMNAHGESVEVTARYWLWRAHQGVSKQPQANEQLEILLGRFPFSYYGLRARAESQEKLAWEFKSFGKQVKVYMTPEQKQGLELATTLLHAGWWEEAQAQLREIPSPQTPEARAVWALYQAAAWDSSRATQAIHESWDLVPDLRQPPFVTAVFPTRFNELISKNAAAVGLHPVLVRSLIKQESAFMPNAVSSSNALGLMQLLPATAKEVAQGLGRKNLVNTEVFRPELNIQLGTTYLKQMLTKFNGQVPLALAAYNAGPTRFGRWLSADERRKALVQGALSPVDEEMAWEQMPWSETRGYVKSILRNAWMYELIAKGQVQLDRPTWKSLVLEAKTQ